VRNSASKRSFQGRKTMSMLSFGVILVSLVFNTVVAFGLCLVEFSQIVYQASSRNDNIFK
jgi:threonine/homoserine/homoserine lactone efflux protein